jgi:putative transposase
MVSAARRREAVLHLVERYGTSQRQACRALRQPRSTQRRPPCPVAAPEELQRARLKEISTKWPRWAFRRAHATLRQEGWKVNHKRVQRLWRDEGLGVPQQSPKRRRLGQSTVPADRLRAERPNHVWALDFMFDTTSDGRPFKVLSMCDEFTKECLEGPLGRSITADAVVVALDKAALLRGLPEHIRGDNGPEFIAAAIQDWCRQSGAKTSFIDPGSPWQNPYGESFNSRARDELFAREIFDSILEAKVLYADWCHAYNVHRPHSALSYQPRAAFAKAYSQS